MTMQNLVNVLVDDHERMRELLAALESQLTLLREGQEPNVELINLVLEYISGYPKLCHHPKEDILYKRLRDSVSPEVTADLADVQADHVLLDKMTSDLAAAVDNLLPGPDAPRRRVIEQIEDFLRHYRLHMEIEESVLFPTAQKHLSSRHWAEIAEALKRLDDPIEQTKFEQGFSQLRQRITAMAFGPH